MSVETELQLMRDNINDSYGIIGNKGGTIPEDKTFENVSESILSMHDTPYTDFSNYVIRNNEVFTNDHNITNVFKDVELLNNNVIPDNYYSKTNITGVVSFPDLTTITDYEVFSSCFQGCSGITGVDFPALSSISYGRMPFAQAFNGCNNIKYANFPSLKKIGYEEFYYAFNDCRELESMDFSGAICIYEGNNAFYGAFRNNMKLTNFSFDNLMWIVNSDYAFNYCFMNNSLLVTATFPSLNHFKTTVPFYDNFFGSTFANDYSLREVSFPALGKYSFDNSQRVFLSMLSATNNVNLHFPSNLQSTISELAGYSSSFGGTNTSILFDLPATCTLTCSGVAGEQFVKHPLKDTETACCWITEDFYTTDYTTFDNRHYVYTSGTSTPSVGDTLYSDPECTTTYGTITQITNL